MRKMTITAMCCLTFAFVCHSQSVKLEPKFPVGKRLVYRMTMTQTNSTTPPGAKQPITQTMRQEQEYAISFLENTKDGGVKAKVKCLMIKMDNSAGGMTMSFNSANNPKDDTPNNPLNIMRAFVDAEYTIIYDAKHQVEDVVGFEDILKKLPANPMMAKMFNKDAMKKMSSADFFAQGLPGNAVQPGQKWDYSMDLDNPISEGCDVTLHYTYAGLRPHDGAKLPELNYEGQFSMTIKPGDAPIPVAMKIENGKMKGTSWFDPKLGLVIDNTCEQTMTISMDLPKPPSQASAQPGMASMKSDLKQTITNTVVKVTDIAAK